ncbi:HEAT repeat domain-containing protein, partial [bacterium]|nr:HEAT repeat domain-containing protein [bacterium]
MQCKCGHENVDGAQFCKSCGEPVDGNELDLNIGDDDQGSIEDLFGQVGGDPTQSEILQIFQDSSSDSEVDDVFDISAPVEQTAPAVPAEPEQDPNAVFDLSGGDSIDDIFAELESGGEKDAPPEVASDNVDDIMGSLEIDTSTADEVMGDVSLDIGDIQSGDESLDDIFSAIESQTEISKDEGLDKTPEQEEIDTISIDDGEEELVTLETSDGGNDEDDDIFAGLNLDTNVGLDSSDSEDLFEIDDSIEEPVEEVDDLTALVQESDSDETSEGGDMDFDLDSFLSDDNDSEDDGMDFGLDDALSDDSGSDEFSLEVEGDDDFSLDFDNILEEDVDDGLGESIIEEEDLMPDSDEEAEIFASFDIEEEDEDETPLPPQIDVLDEEDDDDYEDLLPPKLELDIEEEDDTPLPTQVDVSEEDDDDYEDLLPPKLEVEPLLVEDEEIDIESQPILDEIDDVAEEDAIPVIEEQAVQEPVVAEIAVQKKVVKKQEENIQTLINRLERTPDDDEKYDLIVKIGEKRDPQAIKCLIEQLNYKNRDIVESSIEALGKIGSALAVEPMVRILTTSDDIDLCYQAVRSMGMIGSKIAVDPLLKAIKNKNKNLVYIAIWALGEIGDNNVYSHLRELLNHADSDIRYISALSSGKIMSEELAEDLIAVLSDPVDEVRRASAWSLGEIGYQASVVSLIPLLSSDDHELRRTVIESLGKIGDSESTLHIIDLIPTASRQEKSIISIALGKILDARGCSSLIEFVNFEDDPDVKREAITALGEIQDMMAVEPIVSMLQHERFDVRREAVYALGKIKDETVTSQVIPSIFDTHRQVRTKAAWTLGKLGTVEAITTLINSGDDSCDEVRLEIMNSLGILKTDASVDLLIETLDDKNEDVSEKALWAITQIGDPAVLSLINRIDEDSERLTIKIVRALGNIASIRAVVPLTKLLESSKKVYYSYIEDSLLNIDKMIKSTIFGLPRGEAYDWVRFKIARGLGKAGDDRAFDVLMSIFEDNYEQDDDERANETTVASEEFLQETKRNISYSIAELFGIIGNDVAVEKILDYLTNSENKEVNYWLLQSIGYIGSIKAMDALITIIENQFDLFKLMDIGRAFSLIHGADLNRKLITESKNKSEIVRKSIAFVMGYLKNAQFIDALSVLLKDNSPEVKIVSLQSLEKIANTLAVSHILKVLRDSNADVRKAASHSLGALADPRAIDSLSQLLKDNDVEVRVEAVRALGNIGSSKVVSIIIRATSDTSASVREISA